MELLFRIIGAIGLLAITIGVLSKTRKKQNMLYILGGLLLLAYSYHIQDFIFIILQIVFIIAAVYDEIKTFKANNK